MPSEPVVVTLLVIDVLEKLNIPYLIGGSFASTAYGRVRTTQDVDIVADMQMEQVVPFMQALNDGFYADEQMIQNAIQRLAKLTLPVPKIQSWPNWSGIGWVVKYPNSSGAISRELCSYAATNWISIICKDGPAFYRLRSF